MEGTNHKAKAKQLTLLWIVMFLLLGQFAKEYVGSFGGEGFTVHNVPETYFGAVVLLTLFGSCPLLMRIGYHAKNANMHFHLWFARIIIVQHVFTIAILLLEKIYVIFS